MAEYRARKGLDWIQLVKDVQASGALEGSRVQVQAPAGTCGELYNGRQGVIAKFFYGWITVDIPGRGPTRFRADELVIL